jgi:putative lipoic acid-binding regulatory protein
MMASKNPPDQEIIKRDSLLEFPCKFPIKAMGKQEDGFTAQVESIVLEQAELYPGETVNTNSSGEGKYISVTITIEARSQEQLDRIYMALTACEQVLVAL